MTIVNEQFIISNISHDQYKTYFAEKMSAQATNTQLEISSASNINVAQNKIVPPELTGLNEQKALMIQEFSAQSRLNFEWSRQ